MCSKVISHCDDRRQFLIVDRMEKPQSMLILEAILRTQELQTFGFGELAPLDSC